MENYDGCYDSYGNCNTCGTGCEPKCCPTEYSPISVKNNTAPNVEGSVSHGGTGQGGSGGNNTVNVTLSRSGDLIGGLCDCTTCCKEGVKKLFDFIYYNIGTDPSLTVKLYAYGNIIPSQGDLLGENPLKLINLIDEDLQNSSICGDIINTNEGIVSLCAISIIAFAFDPQDDQNLAIKLAFKHDCSCSCNCSCECGKSIANALCVNGLGGLYDIVIQDAIKIDTSDSTDTNTDTNTLATLEHVYLVATDCNIAIFSDIQGDSTVYYAVPTCKIAKFMRVYSDL